MTYVCKRCIGEPCELSAEGEEFSPSFCPFDDNIETKWELKCAKNTEQANQHDQFPDSGKKEP